MKNSILLLGLPGCGKTFWGEAIAKKLKIPFYDLDKIITRETQLSIHEIFEEGGEALFRKIENSILLQFYENQATEKCVLAVGGGTPAYYNNMNVINEMGTSIYLNLSIEKILENLKQDNINHRPLVHKTQHSELKAYLRKLKNEREDYYKMADYMLFENELSIDNFNIIINDIKQ